MWLPLSNYALEMKFLLLIEFVGKMYFSTFMAYCLVKFIS